MYGLFRKSLKTDDKPETSTQSVSQSLANTSTNASAEGTSTGTFKKIESKESTSNITKDTIKSSSNEWTSKATKKTDSLKRPSVEDGVKPKKPKEDYDQSSKGKNEALSPKPDSDEGKSGASGPSNADTPGSGPKVPPLKIVIPTSDADTGTRTNGKNGNRSYHTALPYIVPSLLSSNQTSPWVPKSQKVTPDTHTVEEQKSPQTRVLRSSNRCGSNISGAPICGMSPTIPEEQLVQTNSPTAVTANAVFTNMCSATRPEQTENESVIIISDSDDDKHVTPDGLTVKKQKSPQTRVLRSSNRSTRSEQTENESIVITISDSDDNEQVVLTASTSTATTSASLATAELSGTELHPGRNKLKASRTESETSDTSTTANVTAVETNPSDTTYKSPPVTSSYQMNFTLKKHILQKRKNLFPVQPKPPSGFKDYLMNRGTYILAGNSNSRVVNPQTPIPANLHEQLKKLFVEQEKERQKLRVQHTVEKEKLVLSVEQEILRVHGRTARSLANQPLPYSACTILKDEEVYNMPPEQKEEKDGHDQSPQSPCSNGHIFLSWLEEIDVKWDKIKESMLLRHRHEAESLYATQKMDWGWKLDELQLLPKIDGNHVPKVLVSNNFNRLPA